MGTLNIGAAATYALNTSQFFNDGLFGAVTANYGYGQVDTTQFLSPATMTFANAQAAVNLISASTSVSPGYQLLNSSGTVLGIATLGTTTPNTSGITLNTATMPAGTSNVNLSTATQTSYNAAATTSSSQQFTYTIGVTTSLALAVAQGTTISQTVTNGISNTTTNSSGVTATQSATVAVSVTGGVSEVGVSASSTVSGSITASVSEAWSQSSAATSNYTTSNTSQTSTMVTTTDTVTIAGPAQGTTTTTTSSSGTTVSNTQYLPVADSTLVVGNTYVASISLTQASYSAPVNQNFQIAGPVMTATNGSYFPAFGSGEIAPTTANYNASTAISNANTYGYSLISGCDTSLFTYQTGSTDMVTYAGMVTSVSSASVGAYIVIQAVATSTTADTSTTTTAMSYDEADGAPLPTLAAPLKNAGSKLDLNYAAKLLQSTKQGVYFDSTKVESSLAPKYVSSDTNLLTLDGGDKHTVKLGNLNYELTKFTNANITTGNGNNVITIAATENGNQFNLGGGNNNITLDGKGNNLFLGGGNNFIQVNGGTGKNYIIDGGAPTALTINSANGFTQVSKWDPTQDTLHFGKNINLSDVKVRHNNQDWSYDVYVKDSLVANLISVGGLSLADPTTKYVYKANLSPTGIHAQTDAGFLTGLYADAFNRAPDSAGLAAWSNTLSKGADRANVAKAFFASSEFEASYKTSGDYVNALYKGLLGRSADSSGLASYTKAIDAGTSHGAVIDSILSSNEFVKVVGVSHPVVGVTIPV